MTSRFEQIHQRSMQIAGDEQSAKGKSDQTSIEPLLLSLEDAAIALSISRTNLYGLVQSGEIPTVTIGRCRRVAVATLRRFVREHMESHEQSVSYQTDGFRS